MKQNAGISPSRLRAIEDSYHNSSLRNIETRAKTKDIKCTIVVNHNLHNQRRIIKSHSGARKGESGTQSDYKDSLSNRKLSREEVRRTERRRIQNNKPLVSYFKQQLDMRYTTREPEDSKNIRIKKINQNYSFGFWEGKPSHNHSASSWKSTMKESAILQRQEESIFTQYNKRQASKMSQKNFHNFELK